MAKRFETGDWSHQLETGLRLHQDDVRRLQQDESFAQDADGVITDHEIGVPGGGGNRLQESRALAFDLQDRITVGRLTFVPGLRHERIHYSYTEFSTDGSPDEITGEGESDLNVILPGLGFTFGLFCLGAVREILGSGSLFGMQLFHDDFQIWVVMILPSGGFFTLAAWLLVFNAYSERKARRLAGGEEVAE